MSQKLPPASDVAARLGEMTAKQVQMLSLLSGVPEHTLLKFRNRQTTDPRYETVRAILPKMRQAVKSTA